MKITLLYQVSSYIRVKKQRNIKNWDQQNDLVIRGFCYIRPLYNEVPLYFTVTRKVCIFVCSVHRLSLLHAQGELSYLFFSTESLVAIFFVFIFLRPWNLKVFRLIFQLWLWVNNASPITHGSKNLHVDAKINLRTNFTSIPGIRIEIRRSWKLLLKGICCFLRDLTMLINSLYAPTRVYH